MTSTERASERILLVDDDAALLQGLRRIHRKRYDLTLATGGPEALEVVERDGPFDIIVADYQMPEMTGAQLLEKLAESDPDMIRIMLTGNADLGTAMEAVNMGRVFRYLTKPCSQEDFVATLDLARDAVRRRRAEQDLLENTLKGSIQVLSEVLALTNPVAFGRASRVQTYVHAVIERFGVTDAWQCESAALLSQIGWVAIPQEVLAALAGGQDLSPVQRKVVDRHPRVGQRILEKIPRMDNVAAIIARQHVRYDDLAREEGLDPIVVRGSQILSVCVAFDELIVDGWSQADAVAQLERDKGAYNHRLIEVLAKVQLLGQASTLKSLTVKALRIGMILDEDVCTPEGKMIITKGNAVTQSMLERLQNFAETGGVREPIRVLVEDDSEADKAAA